MDTELFNLKKRVYQNGMALISKSPLNQKLSKKKDIWVFENRRMNKSIAINEKKLKEFEKLLGVNFF